DLAKPPLMRLALVRMEDRRYHLIWTVHHLLLDGWSTSQLMGEVLRQYGSGPERPALLGFQGRYRDFIEWLSSRNMQAAESYWKSRLGEMTEPTRLMDALSA